MINTFLKDSAFYTLTTFISKLSNVILLPIYIIKLNKEQFGLFDYLTATLTFITLIFSLQIDQSFARYYSTTTLKIKRQSIYSTVQIYYICTFFTVSILVYFYSNSLSKFLFSSINDSSQLLQLVSSLIFFSSCYNFNLNALKWKKKSKQYFYISTLHTILQSTIIAILIFNNYHIYSIFIGQCIAAFLFALYTFFLLINDFKISTFSIFILKRLILYGLPLIPAAISIYLLRYVDRVMIVELLGFNSLGLYSIGIRFSTITLLIFSGFQMAWGPFIFANYKKPEIKNIIIKTFYSLAILALLITLTASLFTPEVIQLIGNSDYKDSYIYVPYLILTNFLFLLCGYFTLGFSLAKKNWPRVYINITGFILNVFLNYFLIKYFSLEGAAFATFITFLFMTILSMKFSNKYFRIEYNFKKLNPIICLTIALLSLSRVLFHSETSTMIVLYKLIIIIIFIYFLSISKLISLKNLLEIIKMK